MKNTDNPTKHPPDEQLIEWMDAPEDLHSQDVQAIEAHVADCDQCTARMETLSLLETGLQALKNAAPQPTSYFRAQVMAALPRDLYAGAAERGRGFRVWVSEQVAALLFLLAGVVYFVLSADA